MLRHDSCGLYLLTESNDNSEKILKENKKLVDLISNILIEHETITKEEIEDAYEENTGHLIVNEFARLNRDPEAVPACLCKNHGPFCWGKDPYHAVESAVVLEEVAKMAYRTELINPRVERAPQDLQDKHYYRKHGKNAYYGQN